METQRTSETLASSLGDSANSCGGEYDMSIEHQSKFVLQGRGTLNDSKLCSN